MSDVEERESEEPQSKVGRMPMTRALVKIRAQIQKAHDLGPVWDGDSEALGDAPMSKRKARHYRES